MHCVFKGVITQWKKNINTYYENNNDLLIIWAIVFLIKEQGGVFYPYNTSLIGYYTYVGPDG